MNLQEALSKFNNVEENGPLNEFKTELTKLASELESLNTYEAFFGKFVEILNLNKKYIISLDDANILGVSFVTMVASMSVTIRLAEEYTFNVINTGELLYALDDVLCYISNKLTPKVKEMNSVIHNVVVEAFTWYASLRPPIDDIKQRADKSRNDTLTNLHNALTS